MNNKVLINNMSNNANIMDISNKLYNKLSDENIETYLISSSLNEQDMLNKIKNNINKNTLIISNDISTNNIEIIYGLNKNDTFVSKIYNNLEDNNFIVDKYYQKRDSINTNLDYDKVIRNFPNNESIIIKYNKINNIDKIVDVLFNTIKSYLGLSNDYYIVQKGDNLYSIAKKFNTTIDNIKRLNNLSNNLLNVGQKLIIKNIPSYGNKYKVVNGDTLYSIARRYNVSVNELKRINNLSNNNINIGQELIIPKHTNIEYIVKSGDTLYSISKKYNINIKDIMNLNNLKSDKISINQKLIIPKI